MRRATPLSASLLASALSVCSGLAVCLALGGAAWADPQAADKEDPLAPSKPAPLIPEAKAGPRELSPHALAVRARWVTVPGWTLAPYLDMHSQLNTGWSVALEYLYRHAGYDVVVSLDYSSLVADPGNFLGKGHDPASDTHYTYFGTLTNNSMLSAAENTGLGVFSFDVSLIGHWNVLPWLEIRAGGGLGLGAVFGNVYMITNSNGNSLQPSVAADINTAKPCSPDYTDGGRDTAASPCLRKYDGWPFNVRLVPVINTLLGLRFRAHQRVFVHLEAGWRLVGFYLGAGPEVRF